MTQKDKRVSTCCSGGSENAVKEFSEESAGIYGDYGGFHH